MGGALLIVAGAWVLCQVFGGNALVRLGIEQGSTGLAKNPGVGPASATTSTAPTITAVAPKGSDG